MVHLCDLSLCISSNKERDDLVKWWVNTGSERLPLAHTDLSYMDVKDADAFESADFLAGKYPSIAHLLALTLIKIRLLVDL